LNRRRAQPTPPSTKLKSFWRKFSTRAKASGKSVNAFMTVPMYAALLSIFIAMIPPLQALIKDLKPFEQAVRSAGQCSSRSSRRCTQVLCWRLVPVTLVVLGAFFYTPPASADSKKGFFERKFRAMVDGPKAAGYPGENKTVFVAVISRMIIVPLLMMPFLAAMAKYDIFEAAADPVFVLSAVLLVSSVSTD
jgi:hypothetical protein